MKVNNFLICNMANMSKENTTNALGIMSNIITPKFPFVLAPITAVMFLEGINSEQGVHDLKLNFVDESLTDIMQEIEFKCDIVAPMNTGNKLYYTLTVMLPPITFTRSGVHKLSVKLDGETIGSTELPVHLVQR